jgi:hypothetical protein
MNKNKNLYKLDDFFLIISYLLFLPLIYIFLPMIRYTIADTSGIQEALLDFVQSRLFLISILAGSIIFLQILGRMIRREEKILVKMLDIIIMYKTISINQLQHTLDMNKQKIEKYIKKLSNIGHLNIYYDGVYAKLEIASQSDHTFNTSQKRENSANAAQNIFSQQKSNNEFQSIPSGQKQSSHNQQHDERFNSGSTVEKNTISSKEDLQNILLNLQGNKNSVKKFNLVLFIVLFLAFWPFAFIYAASFYMKSKKGSVMEESLKNRLNDM